MISLSVPYIRNEEWELVKECIDSEWVSYAGGFVSRFEKELAAFTGSSHAAVMSSGTAALHVALVIAGVGVDDEVVLPSLSFVAPANAIRYCGAWPTFVDVSLKTWQWDLDLLEDFLRNDCTREQDGTLRNRSTGRRIGAIMPVHLLGDMADTPRIARLCAEFGLPLIEDAAEVLGARIHGGGIGAPVPGEEGILRIVCTSFNGNKIMTTGGGGALFSNDAASARLARHLSTTAKTNAIEFDHDRVGYNYRMSNMAAALGVGQLAHMDFFLLRKSEIAAAYTSALAGNPIMAACPPARDGVDSNHWLYTILLRENSRPLLQFMADRSIQCRPLWKALPDLSYLSSCHVHSKENAELMVERALSLPCSVGLSAGDQAQVIATLNDYAASTS